MHGSTHVPPPSPRAVALSAVSHRVSPPLSVIAYMLHHHNQHGPHQSQPTLTLSAFLWAEAAYSGTNKVSDVFAAVLVFAEALLGTEATQGVKEAGFDAVAKKSAAKDVLLLANNVAASLPEASL